MTKKRLSAYVTVELPSPPNFIRVGGSQGMRLPVVQFSDTRLRQIGRAWTVALVAHARKRRKENRRG